MRLNVTDRRQYAALGGGLLAMLAAFALQGCRQADEETGLPEGTNTPLVVLSAAISEETPVGTRAVTTTEITAGSLGIFLRGASGTGYVDKNNLKYNYDTKWKPADTSNTIYLGGEEASVCAYYPHNTTWNDLAAIPLTSQVYLPDTANVSYAADREVDGSSAGCKTSFTLKRAYAKVNFTFTRDNYPSAGNLTKITLANCCTKNTLDIRTGTYATANTVASLSNNVTLTIPAAGGGSVSTVDGDADKNSFLVAPGAIPDYTGVTGMGAETVLTVDGKDVRVLIPKSILPAWEAGKAYNIRIKVTGTGIVLSKLETTDWSSTDVKDDSSKPYVPEVP